MGSLRTISPTAGAFGSDNTAGEAVIIECVAGVALAHGDLVIMDPGTAGNVTSVIGTTTANDKLAVGVVQDPSLIGKTGTTAYASGAGVPVLIQGPARINVGANTPAARDILCASGTTKVAVTNAAATVGQAIGICIHATKDANNAVVALICKM